MKRGHGYVFLAAYVAITVIWTLLQVNSSVTTESFLINLCSISLFFVFLNAMYIQLIKSSREGPILDLWQLPIIIWLAMQVANKRNIIISFFIFAFISSLFIYIIFSKKQRIYIWSIFILYVAWISSYLEKTFLTILLIVLAIVVDTSKKYSYSDFEQINILPISQENQKIVVPASALLLVAICYELKMETIEINILLHYMGCIYILMLLISLAEPISEFDDLKAFYYLASYIEDERDSFSRILHDEIIQDVRASYNLLLLKDADIDSTKRIIGDIELKARNLMNFYSSHIFSEFDMTENIENLIKSIKILYPHKTIETQVAISKSALAALKRESLSRLTFQISKELINNIYKHSNASFIRYMADTDDGDAVRIECISDGATQEDYDSTKSSKGGVLMLRLLIKKNGGSIRYLYSRGILKSEIFLRIGDNI